jgi:2-haloacid dehalogenase
LPAAILDVNETLLDLSGLDETFAQIFDDRAARREWFARLLHLSVATTVVDLPAGFGALGGEALRATGASRGVRIGEREIDVLRAAIGTLRPYPDVAPALAELREAGWRLVALTNSPAAAATAQLGSAGLLEQLENVLSVEAVGRFKPARETYRYATEAAGAAPADTWMVACHDWDLAGASAAGLRTAYVSRPGMAFAAVYPPPTVRAADLRELARLMREHTPG